MSASVLRSTRFSTVTKGACLGTTGSEAIPFGLTGTNSSVRVEHDTAALFGRAATRCYF